MRAAGVSSPARTSVERVLGRTRQSGARSDLGLTRSVIEVQGWDSEPQLARPRGAEDRSGGSTAGALGQTGGLAATGVTQCSYYYYDW